MKWNRETDGETNVMVEIVILIDKIRDTSEPTCVPFACVVSGTIKFEWEYARQIGFGTTFGVTICHV